MVTDMMTHSLQLCVLIIIACVFSWVFVVVNARTKFGYSRIIFLLIKLYCSIFTLIAG